MAQPSDSYVVHNIMFVLYCTVQVDEFVKEVAQVKTMKLRSDSVLVLWRWEWVHKESAKVLQDSEECDSPCSEAEATSDDANDSDTSPNTPTTITHAITFKCIGAVRDKISQQTLRIVRDRMDIGYSVPVKLEPEPDNLWDPKAISFLCNIDGKWTRIGYVVRELADEVHEAISKNQIMSVKFAWVKFLTKWEHGMYAGIEITKIGQWSQRVMARRSTM